MICMQLLQSRVLLNIFRSTALALGVLASIAIGHGTLNAQSRSVSPRVILPLQVGFYHGARALYITPEVGVDPNAPPAIIAAAHQIARDSTPISFRRTSERSRTLQRWTTSSCSLTLPKETY